MKLKGKTVLVTGAGGFIGSHLAERLVAEGCRVRAFLRYNSRNFWGWLEQSPLKKDIEVCSGDIRDFDSVIGAMKGVDAVFHLAALIGIPYSYVSPLAYIRTNIEGTYNVLEASRQLGAKRVVCTSTSEVYGTARHVPIKEDHPLQPQSPYSASKISADNTAMSYHLSFGLPLVIARPFNTYGPRQSARAVIPTIITQILSGSKEIRLGAMRPTRDLNFVSDVADGFLRLAECDGAVGKAVNISSMAEISVGDLAGLIKDLTGADCKFVTEEARLRPVGSEVERLMGDNTLISSLTGWKPGHSLREGLSKTVQWFKDEENMKLYKPEIYNV
ncbi:MAG: SDR family NAD(P)-dependent oxidoreductase [Thermodesulfovibrionales bacterium]|nr:SDR family NAD(P)-dependent oxidoreductase [Thermodesulfovibrionales bacterium]